MGRITRRIRQFQPDRKTFEIIAVIMVVVTAVLFYGFKGESETIILGEDAKDGKNSVSTQSSVSEEVLYVDVDGEVKHPGVYKLVSGARVFEAVEKAGGLKKQADTSGINLAERIKDGEKINVPSKKRTGASDESLSDSPDSDAKGGTGQAMSANGKININSAASEELQKINGIGPATAQKIIDYRDTNGPFKNTEELKNVSGIGDKTYEKMRSFVIV